MRMLVLTSILALSSTTYAQYDGVYEDAGVIDCSQKDASKATNQWSVLKEEFEKRVVGSSASVGWTVYHRSCILHDPITNKCIRKKEDQARGSLVIDGLTNANGDFFCYQQYDPSSKTFGTAYSGHSYYNFHYNGSSSAERKVAGVVVDHPWGNINPTGKIEVWLCATPGTNFTLNYKFRSSAGHPDKPNEFMRHYVAEKLRPVLLTHLKSTLGNPNINILNGDNEYCK